MPRNEELSRKALELLKQRSQLQDLELIHTAEGGEPGTNKPLFLAAARSKRGGPNAVPLRIVLDERGEPVRLTPSVIDPIFTRPPAPVPPELVEGVRVKINPTRNDLTLGECDTFRETVTVTLPKGSVVTKADVYFLADTTGSMTTPLSAVKADAATILSTLASLGSDIQFGVGNYRDFQSGDAYAFQHQQPPTSVMADADAAINTWTIGNGLDWPEGQFFALDQLAQPPGGTIGWRPGAKRIIVWFGDAPGHDPICASISGLGYDITEASVTSKLVAEEITVLAISIGTNLGALDGDPNSYSTDYGSCTPAGNAGQATRIASATGGQHATGVNSTALVSTIIDLVKAAFTIGNVRLVARGAIAQFVKSITPAGGYGPLDPSKEHVLKFDVVFAGGAVDCAKRPQVFTGSLDAVADGAVIVRKPTVVTVPACKYVYAVKFVCGVQDDCGCGCTPVRPGTYATEVNILNSGCHTAAIDTRVIPLVQSGAVIGREPRVSSPKAAGRLTLPSGTATMQDCCRLSEMLLGAVPGQTQPLSIGWLQITSSHPLHVTAVYTLTGANGSLCTEVETIQPASH